MQDLCHSVASTCGDEAQISYGEISWMSGNDPEIRGGMSNHFVWKRVTNAHQSMVAGLASEHCGHDSRICIRRTWRFVIACAVGDAQLADRHTSGCRVRWIHRSLASTAASGSVDNPSTE
jgi:hypothetical protein